MKEHWAKVTMIEIVAISLLPGVGHPPDRPRAVIRHHQGPVLGHGHASRAAPDVALLGDEAHEEVFVLAGRLAVLHRDADDLVAGATRPVPRAVLGGEGLVAELLRKLVAVVERQVN